MARSKGEGGITRLEDKPKARCRLWRLEARDPSGHLRFRRVHGTYSQAESAMRAFSAELDARGVGDETFAEYAARWQASREASPQTKAKEDVRIRNLCKAIGHMRLRDIRRMDVQEALNSIRDGGNLSGRELSGTTMYGIHQTLRQMLQDAVYDGLMDANPAAMVRPPRKDTKPKKAASMDDVARMVDGLAMLPLDGFTVGVRLAVLAGLRRGEVVGLQWGDVADGRIAVRRSVQSRYGTVKEPKTESGRRSVSMLPELEADLERWREQQRFRLAALGIEQGDGTPVVTSAAGTRLDSSNLYRWWRKNGPALFGIDCSLHELRHTFLTMLGNSGASAAALKSIAGWSSLAMADVYVHRDEDADADAVRMLESRLSAR